jgi:hypothetical protein
MQRVRVRHFDRLRSRLSTPLIYAGPFLFLSMLVWGLVLTIAGADSSSFLTFALGTFVVSFLLAFLVWAPERPAETSPRQNVPSQEDVEGLIGALKVLHPQDALVMTRLHRESLHRGLTIATSQELMAARGERLAIVWLETIRTLCDTGAMPQVRDVLNRLDGEHLWASVRMEAAECLAALEERAKLERNGDGLLRSAKGPKRNDLLRPAGNSATEDQEALLRVSERGEE